MAVIYEPRGKAREYSALACNLYTGCIHGCDYCYAPKFLFKNIESFHKEAYPRKDIISKIKKEILNLKSEEHILLCFTCDPYQKAEEEFLITRQTIELFNQKNLKYKILTKSKLILRDIDFIRKDLSMIGSTISFKNESLRKIHEPFADSIIDRISFLKKFHDEGFYTWVSVEPVLDPVSALDAIKELGFVDMIKVGKLNGVPNTIDWKKFRYDAVELLNSMGNQYYIKKDLDKYK
jgi:DNA repair photolyase